MERLDEFICSQKVCLTFLRYRSSDIVRADAKRAFLRRKYTSTKKVHYTEGWVEFKDKRIARSVADMLNAQPIGGKKGTRWRDDVWTMKYLPKFKWNMLTEQIGEHVGCGSSMVTDAFNYNSARSCSSCCTFAR